MSAAQEVRLVRPHVGLMESYIEGLLEFQAEGLPWMMGLDVDELRRDFAGFVGRQLDKWTAWTRDQPVRQTVLWAVLDEEFVGIVDIRHALNEDLRVVGGHIGYQTRPGVRGQGVATAMLRQALPIAKEIGIAEALLTCNDDNGASIRVIEKNGGVLRETRPQHPGGPMKRYYWIRL